MNIAVIAIAIIAVGGLLTVIVLQQRMIMKSQAFFMIAKDPRAGMEVMKTIAEKNYEKKEREKDAEAAKKHARFKAIIQSGEASEEEIKEFGLQGDSV